MSYSTNILIVNLSRTTTMFSECWTVTQGNDSHIVGLCNYQSFSRVSKSVHKMHRSQRLAVELAFALYPLNKVNP